MGSIKEEAQNLETSTTKNVTDLPLLDINMELETFTGINSEGAKFSYKYVAGKDNIKYRVPYTVLSQIRAYLEENSEQTLFRVKKSGEGKKTMYTVIPVIEKEGKKK